MAQEHDYFVKVVFVGDAKVGKTKVLDRFVNDRYTDDYKATIQAGFQSKKVNDEKVGKISFNCWDIAGEERHRRVFSAYYQGAHVVAVVVDATNADSFEGAKQWIAEVKTYAPETAQFMLVVNKRDMEEPHVIEALDDLIEALVDNEAFPAFQGTPVVHTSAKTGDGISEPDDDGKTLQEILVTQAKKALAAEAEQAKLNPEKATHPDKPNQPQTTPWYKSGRFWISVGVTVALTALAVGLTFGLGGGFAAVAAWKAVETIGLGFVANLSGANLVAAAIGFATLIYGAASALLVSIANMIVSAVKGGGTGEPSSTLGQGPAGLGSSSYGSFGHGSGLGSKLDEHPSNPPITGSHDDHQEGDPASRKGAMPGPGGSSQEGG